MDAEGDDPDRLRVGRWVPDEDDDEPGPPLPAGENTLGRRFPWPEEIGRPDPDDPTRHGGQPPTPPYEFPEPVRDGSPPIRQPAPVPEDEIAGVRHDELGQDRRYRGLRRADGALDRRWPIVGGALLVVIVALAVLIVLVAMPARRTAVAPPNGAGAASVSVAASPQRSPAMSAAPASAPAAVPTATPVLNVPPPQPPSATPFRSVTYQAESAGNVLGGSALVQAYPGASGGKIVRTIGAWGGLLGPGTLTFPNVAVPANGVYVLTFFYVHLDNAAQRTVLITIGGVGSFAVTVLGTSTCCAGKAVAVPLRKGVNSITFGNPDGHAPSLDKIVVSVL
ncbi:MAG: hypothetical protein V7603_34 [Micromonosporaceae bacterium]